MEALVDVCCFAGSVRTDPHLQKAADIENNGGMKNKGIYSAVLSAFLFGVSPVACKAIVGQMPPALLAGILYLGSGLGLSAVIYRHNHDIGKLVHGLSRRQWGNLVGAILSGGGWLRHFS